MDSMLYFMWSCDDKSVANSKVCLEPMKSLLSTEVQASVYIALIRGLGNKSGGWVISNKKCALIDND